MAALKITNFGGEVPRADPLSIAPNGAQLNRNLLASTPEFRPLMADKEVGSATVGAKTLYRTSRDSTGELRSDDTSGWIVSTDDLNYVKGQVNDDATERTVVSDNSGVERPRVIDATGEDRLLGVPRPPKVSLSLNETPQFTMDDALAWVSDEMYPALKDALQASIGLFHNLDGKPLAGAEELYGLTPRADNLNMSTFSMPLARADELQLRSAGFGGFAEGGNYLIAIHTSPRWAKVDKAQLANKLRAIEHPANGEQLFSDDKIDVLVDRLDKAFSPQRSTIAYYRNQLDGAVQSFVEALGFADGTLGPRPQPPAKPTSPEFIPDPGFGDSDRRLKKDIVPAGVHPGTGLPLYRFRYTDDPEFLWLGVMSDDVRKVAPQAVRVGPGGFDQVGYGMLGIELQKVG